MSGPRVLIVDDEQQLRLALRRMLEGNGYTVHEAEDGHSVIGAVETFHPDVVLLDLMLPDINGVDLCGLIREFSQTPIIVLSVLGDEASKVNALDAGADDYLTKPFGSEELLARVRVALRRGASDRNQQAVFRSGDLTVDLERRHVEVAGASLHLTPTEYALLKYLVLNQGKVITQPMLLRAVWGAGYTQDSHLLRTYVNQLRVKLNDDRMSPKYIQTEPGVGYRFLMEPES